MRGTGVTADDLTDALAEATAAFDAGNHAWGRFYLYVLRRYQGEPPAPDAAPVRSALQEAALSVPQEATRAAACEFAAALAAVCGALAVFVDALPETLRTGDAVVAPESFEEALAALAPWVDDAYDAG